MWRRSMNYLTIKQVAERLQVSLGTVYHLCAQGRMPHHRVGLGRGTIRISEEQFQRYVAETESGGAEAVPPPHVPLRDIMFRGPSP